LFAQVTTALGVIPLPGAPDASSHSFARRASSSVARPGATMYLSHACAPSRCAATYSAHAPDEVDEELELEEHANDATPAATRNETMTDDERTMPLAYHNAPRRPKRAG
jgi:hypothetical protein